MPSPHNMQSKRDLLIEALSYIKKFQGQTIVIKYGGAAMVEEQLKQSFAQDIVLLQSLGLRLVIVHGGGPEISKALQQMGQETQFIDGMRMTSQEDMPIVEMALSGKVNKEIIAHLHSFGGKAVGLSGKDGQLIEVQKKLHKQHIDLGYVGEVRQINPEVLKVLLDSGFLPVVSPIGFNSKEGKTYNVNADLAASHIAIAMQANKLIFMTDVNGILIDGKLQQELNLSQIQSFIADGVISGGMLPKTESALLAIQSGVKSAHIINGSDQHSIISELFTDQGIGTLVLR